MQHHVFRRFLVKSKIDGEKGLLELVGKEGEVQRVSFGDLDDFLEMRAITQYSLTIKSAIDKISIILSVDESRGTMVTFPDINLDVAWGTHLHHKI